MGRAKVVKYCNSRFRGSLDENVCNILEKLLNTQCVSSFKHIIYNLADGDVDNIIKAMKNYGVMPLDVERPLGTLRDEQTIGVAYMYWAKKLVLGDSVGLGKTVETAGLMRYLQLEYAKQGKEFRYLFLTTKNLVDQTRAEMVKFTGEYVETLFGEAKNCEKYEKEHYNGTDYSLVGVHSLVKQPKFINWLMSCDEFPFDAIVFDESSPLGSTSSDLAKSAKQLFKFFERIYLLNATPFESRLDIFVNQLSILDNEFLPTKTALQKEYYEYSYKGMYPKPTGKYKNAEQLRELVKYRYLARTRKELGAKMIDSDFRLILSPLSPVQKRLMRGVSLWRMVCDCPNYFNLSFSDDPVEFNEENVPKLDSLGHLFDTDLKDVDSILLYVPYLETQSSVSFWLEEQGYSYGVLNGGTKTDERNDTIRRFKNKEFRILITNVQKGLNFGSCDYCVFYSFDPTPGKMTQMEGRITRDFDIINKHVYLLCSEGREYNYLIDVVKPRAEASAKFTTADISCIMNLLLGGN